MNINQVELASELAHLKLKDYASILNTEERENTFPNGLTVYIQEEDVTCYTEEAQDLFNIYYDEYWDIIENCKE